MATQETMACGKAVIVSKFGGIRNIIKHGENRLLADPSNSLKFANAIIRRLNNQEKAKIIGKNAYKTVQGNFTWENIPISFLVFVNNIFKLKNSDQKLGI